MNGELLAWLNLRGVGADCPPGNTDVRQRAKSHDRASGRDDAFGRIEYLFLELLCRDARDRSGVCLAAFKQSPRDIVAPTSPAFGGMAWAHPIAPIVVELAREKTRHFDGEPRT